MLYTIIVSKKIIVEVENSNKLQFLVDHGIEAINMSGTIVAEVEEINYARSTNFYEKTWVNSKKGKKVLK